MIRSCRRGPIEMASAETLAVEVGGGLGGGVTIEWDGAALRAARAPSWRLRGELDAGRIAELRVFSAAFEDGSLLGVGSLRPRGAAGHDADELAAVLARPEAEPTEVDEVRLSVEYDGDGRPRRAGLELYADPDAPPLRVAADRSESSGPDPNSDAIAMDFRLDGTSGTGSCEVRRP
jgi:hypothetical protein